MLFDIGPNTCAASAGLGLPVTVFPGGVLTGLESQVAWVTAECIGSRPASNGGIAGYSGSVYAIGIGLLGFLTLLPVIF